MLLFFFALAALQTTGGTDRPTSPRDTPTGDVVVTGIRLDDSAAAHKSCIERHCPPGQDIAATLAHAENLFVAGDYHAARQTLGRAIGRDKRFAASYPVPVSQLLRANANVALHLGESDGYRIGTIDVVAALKAGLPGDDPRIMAAQVEVGDSFARVGRFDAAISAYRGVERHAHDRGLSILEGHARLRIAVLYVALALEAPQDYGADARRAIGAITDSSDAKLANFVLAAKVLRARLASKAGDASAIDHLVADFRGSVGTTPVLLYSPSIRLPERAFRTADAQLVGTDANSLIAISSGSELARRASYDFEGQWVDVGFWVSPNGKVSDPAVLRQSAHLAGDWVRPIMTAVSARRYATLALDPADPGIFRVERYSFTSFWESDKTGTHLRTRSTTPRIEILDLSIDPAPPKS